MNPLNRRMFRKKGGGATGIMASGPELIKANMGYYNNSVTSDYTLPFGSTTYSLSPTEIGSSIITVKPNLKKADLETVEPIDPKQVLSKDEIEKIRQENLKKKDIDAINVTNKKLLKPITTKSFPDSKNLALKIDQSDPMPGDADTDIVTEKEAAKILKPSDAGISDIYDPEGRKKEIQKSLPTNLANIQEINQEIIEKNRRAISDMSSYDDQLFFGTTLNKATKDLQDELNKQGKEITLADVRDQGIKLLGYDPDKLDENFDEDRRSAFFMSLMKAGLAIASGESDSALVNVAKGLNYGLTSYGEDVKTLSKQLREDRKDAANTFYRLLGDKKSEQLAKEALNLQKKITLRDIVATKVGEEKNLAIKEMEMENRNAELRINFYKILNEQNRHEQNFDLKERELKANIKNAMFRLVPDKLRLFQGSGEITLIDETKGFTLDNMIISDKLTDAFLAELENLKGGKAFAKQKLSVKQKLISEEDQYFGISKGQDTKDKNFGVYIGDFEKDYLQQQQKESLGSGVLKDYFNLARQVKGKINLSQVPSGIKKYILKDAVTILNNNPDIFNLQDPEADKILNPSSTQ
jgi:ferredoxin-fold anticodon binding domain-containing protein